MILYLIIFSLLIQNCEITNVHITLSKGFPTIPKVKEGAHGLRGLKCDHIQNKQTRLILIFTWLIFTSSTN